MSFINRNFEFEAELENHLLGSQNVYRLHYVDYHRIGEGYSSNFNNVGMIDWPFQPFMFSKGMSREDGFKVLSYLTDYIEDHFGVDSCSYGSVKTLDCAIDLERLGFVRLNQNINEKDIIDLFTITGRILLFKKSKDYLKYFEWYSQGVSFEEVKNIYNKCGIEFYDLILESSVGDVLPGKNQDRQLKKKRVI